MTGETSRKETKALFTSQRSNTCHMGTIRPVSGWVDGWAGPGTQQTGPSSKVGSVGSDLGIQFSLAAIRSRAQHDSPPGPRRQPFSSTQQPPKETKKETSKGGVGRHVLSSMSKDVLSRHSQSCWRRIKGPASQSDGIAGGGHLVTLAQWPQNHGPGPRRAIYSTLYRYLRTALGSYCGMGGWDPYCHARQVLRLPFPVFFRSGWGAHPPEGTGQGRSYATQRAPMGLLAMGQGLPSWVQRYKDPGSPPPRMQFLSVLL